MQKLNDQNKLAVLCILIVLAVAIWTRGNQGVHENPAVGEDIFQHARANENIAFVKLAAATPQMEEKLQLLEATIQADFSQNPFAPPL